MITYDRPAFSIAMDLVAKAAELRGIEPEDVMSRNRKQHLAYTRFGVVYVLRHAMGLTLKRIARLLGYDDHTSIIHAERVAARLAASDPDYMKFINALYAHAMAIRPKRIEVQEAA